MSETQEAPGAPVSTMLALGHQLAEQFRRDGGASYRLASLTYPAALRRPMEAAMNAAAAEDQYLNRCHALGLDMDDARKILADTITAADQHRFPPGEVWDRAWQQAIEMSMQ